MAASVKNKIRFGTLFLFFLLLLSGGVGIFYLVKFKNDAKDILKDNYESLDYCHTMLNALDSIALNPPIYLAKFEKVLHDQEANLTEPGEEKATTILRVQFDKLKAGDTSFGVRPIIAQQLQHILAVNMVAIYQKNQKAEAAANKALAYISLIGAVVFLIAFTFTINFPFIVTEPIRQLTEAIKQVGSKNYKHRIHIDSKDEFGQLADAYNEMAERLEYFESSNLNRLMFEKSRAESVINSLKDASIGIDKNNNILFANFQALQLLGVEARDVVGKSVDEITNKNDLFRYLIDNNNSMPFKIVVENKENYFVKEVIDVPLQDSKSTVIVLKNITSYKELDVAKTNFIATISHELKTPLASSDFSLKLLEDERIGHLTHEQKELIQHLKQDNHRMLRILSELLNMSQVEAGKMQLDIKEVHPHSIVDNAINAVNTAAKEKRIIIQKNIPEQMPAIAIDAEKTIWVLNNFLTNAIKYSPENSNINISVKKADHKIVFTVTDQGPGIPEEYLPKVFDRYFKVPGSKAKGTGLGLAISKEFIEAQGGNIWAESELGRGSSFNFSLNAL
ncbi:cell wall metabolism sensor histidine kinase WalK [Chitinophagaceae bacterium LB-8]|uniref:histidine kinase n=1 Tax=Paraflavisolibacter caeni TaxID=2982496 RepID=A0A9X2XUM3_9BACT|nr:ATP-binding protein [Paraflavisolibacter caeni]MCU7548935.1 cell wall metabolism sensor histidine kinase WalK [Paraflavisolibacter caeni]